MDCYKLNDLPILRKKKNNEEKLELILKLNFNPLGGLGSGTKSRFS